MPTSPSHAQVFFLKAQYRGGEVHLDQRELQDYVWVTKDELKGYVSEDYYSAVAPTLIE